MWVRVVAASEVTMHLDSMILTGQWLTHNTLCPLKQLKIVIRIIVIDSRHFRATTIFQLIVIFDSELDECLYGQEEINPIILRSRSKDHRLTYVKHDGQPTIRSILGHFVTIIGFRLRILDPSLLNEKMYVDQRLTKLT